MKETETRYEMKEKDGDLRVTVKSRLKRDLKLKKKLK